MFRFRYIAVLGLLLSACQPGNVRQAQVPENGPYLDVINQQAAADPSWFGNNAQERSKLQKKYTGSVAPQLATYLENDIYFVENTTIRSYHERILARLLQNWSGRKPEVSLVFESDENPNAYVDVYNQIHVSTGLLRSVDNEDQLAAVLAHELSHVLLRHNQSKSATNSVSWSLEMAGALSITAAGVAYNKKQDEKYKDYASRALLGSQSLGLAWSDMLAPTWARNYERQADRLGIDLLMRANYNYEEFYKVIEKLNDSNLRRSQRQQFFSTLVASLLQQNKNRFYKGSADNRKDKLVGDAGYLGASSFAALTFDAVARGNVEHDNREERIDTLKTYVQEAHQGGDLPPVADTASLTEVLQQREVKRMLAADLAAIETIQALNRNDLGSARKGSRTLEYGFNGRATSVGIARSFMDMKQRKPRQAHQVLTRMLDNPHAPVEAYLRLSRLYQQSGNYTASRDTLELGRSRIGRNYRFLPDLVATHKALGDIKSAEQYAIECGRVDSDNLSLASVFLSNARPGSTTYYQVCSRKLGYDVIAKRRQEAAVAAQQQKQQREKTKQQQKEYRKMLKNLFD